MVHWYGVGINEEYEQPNTFVLDPGFVQKEMGNTGARTFGMDKAPIAVDEYVDGMFQVLTMATKEKHGGKIVLYSGDVQTW